MCGGVTTVEQESRTANCSDARRPRLAEHGLSKLKEEWRTHPVLFVGALVVFFWTWRLYALHYAGQAIPYNSDEVAGNNLVWAWIHGYHQDSVITPDTYLMKYPLFALVNYLPAGPLTKLFVECWACLAAMAMLVVKATDRLALVLAPLKRGWVLLIAGMVLIATPSASFFWLSYPTSRNVEFGVAALLLVELYRYYSGHATWIKGKMCWLATAVVSVLFANDALTLYTIGLPVFLVALLSWLLAKPNPALASKAKFVALHIAIAAIASEVILLFLKTVCAVHLSGAPTATVSAEQALLNVKYLVTSSGELYGVNLWGMQLSLSGIATVALHCGVLIVALYGMLAMWRRREQRPLAVVTVVLVGTAIAAFCFTETAGVGGDRFLNYVVTLEGIAVAAAVINMPNRGVYLTLLLTAAAGLVVLRPMVADTLKGRVEPNDGAFSLVSTVQSLHLRKGYAEYWTAGIDSYISQHKVDLVSTWCGSNQRVSYFDWWSDRGELSEVRAKRTFYVFTPGDAADCTPPELRDQFGKPMRVVPVVGAGITSGTEILIYGYDIRKQFVPPVLP